MVFHELHLIQQFDKPPKPVLIICAEVFTIYINGNPSVEDISLFGYEMKIMQYAADTT